MQITVRYKSHPQSQITFPGVTFQFNSFENTQLRFEIRNHSQLIWYILYKLYTRVFRDNSE